VTAPSSLPPTSAPMDWHRSQWQRFAALLDSGQFPHALLLAGPQHSGKSQLALALARLLLCEDAGNTNCGRCHACELSAAGVHGDFRWVSPEDNSRVIKVDQIRGAVEFATRTATFGARKVVVLHPADTMNLNACNALLKSLEEPAGNTHWVLVADRLFALPATVRSRCQIHHLGTPDESDCLDWLDTSTGSREQSRELLALADGRPLLAHRYHIEGTGQAVATRRRGLEALLSGRLNVPEVAALWGDAEAGALLQDVAAELHRLAGALPLEALRTRQGRAVFRVLDDVLQLQRAVDGGSNPARQLLLETTLLKIRRELGGCQLGVTI